MKLPLSACALLGSMLALSGCSTVKYPGTPDATPPSAIDLILQTDPDPGQSHTLQAGIRPPGTPITRQGKRIVPSNLEIVISVAARDDESGIKEIRVSGIRNVCQSDPGGTTAHSVDYEGARVWLLKDFAPSGTGNIPKQTSTGNRVLAEPLMKRPLPGGGEITGDNAGFQFSAEVTNGAGLKSYSQVLVYSVGMIACP